MTVVAIIFVARINVGYYVAITAMKAKILWMAKYIFINMF